MAIADGLRKLNRILPPGSRSAIMGAPNRPDEGGIAISWGKATADWDSSTPDAITLIPCDAAGTVAAGASNVTCMILSPGTSTPACVLIKAGDVLAYLATTFTVSGAAVFGGILLSVPMMPAGGVLYQVLQIGEGGKVYWDYVRCA